jgi:hypothetical protein
MNIGIYFVQELVCRCHIIVGVRCKLESVIVSKLAWSHAGFSNRQKSPALSFGARLHRFARPLEHATTGRE